MIAITASSSMSVNLRISKATTGIGPDRPDPSGAAHASRRSSWSSPLPFAMRWDGVEDAGRRVTAHKYAQALVHGGGKVFRRGAPGNHGRGGG